MRIALINPPDGNVEGRVVEECAISVEDHTGGLVLVGNEAVDNRSPTRKSSFSSMI